MQNLNCELSRPTTVPSGYRPGERSILVAGMGEGARPFLPLSVTTGHLVRSVNEGAK